jgi:hypothetical protein
MGRLIPAGTGMDFYRNVKVERDDTADQSIGLDQEFADLPDIISLPEAATTKAAVATGDGDEGGEEK